MRRQSSPRRVCPPSELPPLPAAGAPRRKQQRRRLVVSGSSDPDALPSPGGGGHEASAGDDRSPGSRGPLPSSCPSPKTYPRLQTLAQLAGKYVRDLHLGDFVARSELRWRRFEGADAPHSARERAHAAAQDSGALVIQCAWRKHAAVLTRKRLLAAVWGRQLQVAARISTRTAGLVRVLELANAANSRLVALAGALDMAKDTLPACGLYYHAPATLLAWWLGYASAKTVGRRFLRRSPAILRAVDLPVRQACRTLARLWRSIVPLATLTIQCCVRVFVARQLLGRRRLQRLRQAAAVQLQGFVRACNAQHLAARVRRRCAAVRVQCFWRRHRAGKCLRHQRIARVATRFCAPLLLQAARQATVKLRETSALKIQKQYRGSRARAQFRGLLGLNEQQKWRKNPSRGFLFFAQKRYDLAALFLETCFRQGLFQGDPRSGPLPQQGAVSWVDEVPTSAKPRRKVASGSRMSFSFSAAPTKLGPDWVLQGEGNGANDIEATGGAADVAARLRFWQTYATSHFQVFEATGDVLNLRQARVGWESYLRVDAVANSWPAFRGSVAGALQELRARSSLGLVQCLFWGGKRNDRDQALALSLKLLEERDGDSTDDARQEAQLLMISSMLYFEQARYACSCAQLEKLLLLPQQTTFTDVEIRFALALVLRRRFEASCSGGQGADRANDPEGAALLRTAAQLLKQCHRAIELWPAVGFYHGWLRKSDAKRLLETEPVGAFLLFHALDAADASGKRSDVESTSPEGKLLLQVKTTDRPLRLASLRIEFSTDTGVYRARKLPSHRGHFSLHGFVASLPTAAGVKMELGVRRRLHNPPLRSKLEQTGVDGCEKEALRALLLPWSEWERQLTEERELFSSPRTDSRWKRRNETWSAVCFEMAQALEGSQAWLFAEAAAREALAHSRARAHRANVCFLAARVSLNVQKRTESALFMQQARLEKDSRQPSAVGALFITNLTAVQRALSPNVSLSKQEPFAVRLERVQKLERMCLKAWRFDSLASGLRGDALREATLLQRIDDEAYATCGDTFFTRSLLKAHVRAYLAPGVWYEERHLKCAFRCVVRLFERFHTLQSSWPEQLTNLAAHFGDKSLQRGPPKPRAFTVSLLLLSWHHMPFLICFELSEVLYRSSIVAAGRKSRSPSPLIDVYESLLGRLRGSQPRTDVYASYEELLLLRLAFLHAAKATQAERSWRHLGSAIASIDEILTQRKLRARTGSSATVGRQAKAINWPCSIRLPLALSDAEVAFIRGFFTEMREDLLHVPVGQRDSWRDYHALHEEVLELVKQLPPPGQASGGRMLNSVRSRAENLQGLRIFLGASQHVKSANLLRSQPFVAIRHEGATSVSQTPPDWTNLSPSWAEDVEIPVNSPHATISISLMDRTRRTTRWQDAEMVGSVSLAMQELLAAPDGVTEGRFYDLKAATARAAAGPSVRLFLGFQVLVKPTQTLPPFASRTAAWATRRGNWDVEDVRTHLHGDLRVFVASRWIWSRFANVFMADQDLCIAKWFFSKAMRLTPTLQRRTSVQGVRLNLKESLEIAMDLVGLCRCYRACLGESPWGEQAAPFLAQAEGLLARSSAQSGREYASTWLRPALEKQLAVVRGLIEETRGVRRIGSLEEASRQKTPASSEWLKLTSVDPISRELRTRYLN
ncbi:hypothetical protein BBJ28_00017745 [Nothophytophthora sp. Chile5]|nr:hypothetical protein BBJ28_00017745 [Nothophytophthora sp. Chile5]